MTLILPQIKFEAIPSKDIGRDAFLAKADASHHIPGFEHDNFSSMVLLWI